MNIFKTILVFILTLESRLILKKYKPFIIAVTGSVGKTSTKDAIYSVLKDQSNYVRKSEKSMNSELGLPLTIIGVPNAWHNISGWINNIIKGIKLIFIKNDYPDCLILEIGADHPGDISRITNWLHPDISVITQVSNMPVHVEFFKSPIEVFEEKAYLATAIKKGGTLVLFADNEKIMSLSGRVKDIKVISFGMAENSTIKGSDQRIVYELGEVQVSDSVSGDSGLVSGSKIPSGFTFKLETKGESVPVSIKGILGKSYMYPLLAAAAVGTARNISISSIVNGLNDYDAPKGRMNIIAGMNDSILIDDTYNSSPEAVLSALNTLKDVECNGSKIAVLGDMMELGSYSSEEHRKIGREVVNVASELITVGQRSRVTADEAVKSGMIVSKVHSFDSSVQAGEYLKSILKIGDIVLVKGSQSIRMERAITILMKNPDQAWKLLVRQEKEWLDKK